MKPQAATSLSEIRRGLPAEAARLLAWIWDSFVRDGTWPSTRLAHRDQGKKACQRALEQVDKRVVVQASGLGDDDLPSYRLTLLGCVLADTSDTAFDLLVAFLVRLRRAYLEHPAIRRIASTDIQDDLGLDPGATDLLGGLLLSHTNIRVWVGGAKSKASWEVTIGDGVDDLGETTDMRSWLAHQLVSADWAMETGPTTTMSDNQPSAVTPRVFVGHSSEDHDIVARIVELLRTSLGLRSDEIRCTSIDGHRLPAGVNTEAALRAEVHASEVFVGVVSSSSLRSAYVLFELGARWGTDKPLLPILAPGIRASTLPAPLNSIHCMECTRGQLHQLVNEIAQALSITPEPPQSYQDSIERILHLPNQMSANSPARQRRRSGQDLLPEELRLLVLLAGQGHTEPERLTCRQIAERMGISIAEVDELLENLPRALVSRCIVARQPITYEILPTGLDQLDRRKLLREETNM